MAQEKVTFQIVGNAIFASRCSLDDVLSDPKQF